jgi:hypothetical protein
LVIWTVNGFSVDTVSTSLEQDAHITNKENIVKSLNGNVVVIISKLQLF